MMIFKNGKWVSSKRIDNNSSVTRFQDIKYFYGNLVDYLRVIMCALAGFTIVWGYPFLTAVLIIGSHLLDWIDGPIARYFNQCTIFGSGVDWLADVQAQIVTMVWWASLDSSSIPWMMIATTIELSLCIIDFAQTATLKYPVPGRKTGFFIITQWCTPYGTYTKFGTFLWLAYPFYCVACCLDLSWKERSELTGFILDIMEKALFIPAIMYIWCEFGQLNLILNNWTEPKRDYTKSQPIYSDGGFSVLGTVPKEKQELLVTTMDNIKKKLGDDYNKSLDSKQIHWINLAQHNGRAPIWKDLDRLDELEAWVNELYKDYYDPTTDDLDGYGFIINPIGSQTQTWHLDYSSGYSTIFIPISKLTPSNCPQYLVLPEISDSLFKELVEDKSNNVSLDDLLKDQDYVSVRQAIVKPFSILRMEFKAIHRGISNSENFHRIVFWISARKKTSPKIPIEPLIQDFAKYD